MSVNHRRLKQTLPLHIVSDRDTLGRTDQALTAAYLDGLINWIMEEEAQNSRKGPIVVQTDAGAAHGCVTLVEMMHLPVSPSASLHPNFAARSKSEQGLLRTSVRGTTRGVTTAHCARPSPCGRPRLSVGIWE